MLLLFAPDAEDECLQEQIVSVLETAFAECDMTLVVLLEDGTSRAGSRLIAARGWPPCARSTISPPELSCSSWSARTAA
ncbi:MAG: hypothetical protein ACI835_005304 [Planctomycetota bacterium]